MNLLGTPALSIGEACNLACTSEAIAPKAGNVYPGKAFDNLSVLDFLSAAAVSGDVLHEAADHSIGQLVWRLVQRSRTITQSNANLGIALLLTPLAKAASACASFPSTANLRKQTVRVLEELDGQDGRLVYDAIRFATAGGLGRVDEADVNEMQTEVDLMAAMRSAADRDQIANLYATGFASLFDNVVPCLRDCVANEGDLLRGITHGQILLLSDQIDSLIARKCGLAIAEEARQRAIACRQHHGFSHSDPHWIEFDAWLRGDGNRRNPGTTADMIAAALFVLLFCTE